MKYLKEAFRLTKAQLLPGKIGREIDAPGRAYFEKHGLVEVPRLPVRPHDRPARGRVAVLRPEQRRRAQAGHDRLRRRQLLRPSRVQRRPDRDRATRSRRAGAVPMSEKMDRMFAEG